MVSNLQLSLHRRPECHRSEVTLTRSQSTLSLHQRNITAHRLVHGRSTGRGWDGRSPLVNTKSHESWAFHRVHESDNLTHLPRLSMTSRPPWSFLPSGRIPDDYKWNDQSNSFQQSHDPMNGVEMPHQKCREILSWKHTPAWLFMSRVRTIHQHSSSAAAS